MAGREGSTRSSFRTIAALTLIPVVAVGAYFLITTLIRRSAPPSPATREKAQPAPSPRVIAKAISVVPRVRGSIILILDDIGFEGQPIDQAMAIDPDINFSILPNGTRASEFARRIHARGFELLCHLPMEPVGTESPGRNAILTSMSDEQIAATVRANLEAVPHARGVNNHMGSRATADRRVMTDVLAALPRTMYFIDSRTVGGSVAASVARSMKIPTAVRDVFLDDVPTEAAVRRQLAALAQIAEKEGVAIGIGHPRPATLKVLAADVPRLRERGFRLVRGSQAVN